MRLGRARRQHVLREQLTRDRFRLRRDRLRVGRHLVNQIAFRKLSILDRKHRRAVRAIEHEHESVLARLDDRVDGASVVLDRRKCRRRREVSIPDVVADTLEVPDAFTGVSLQRDQTVRVKIVTGPIRAVEVRRSGPGRHVDDATRFVERHVQRRH